MYCSIFVLGTLFITLSIQGRFYSDWVTSLRHSAFQVISILTTTGYASADFEVWPALTQILLFLFMFVGAMAGSTGGGMKVVRIIIGFKMGVLQIRKLFYPNLISFIKVGKRAVSGRIVNVVMGFLLLYVGIFIVGIIILSAFGVDFVTTFSAVAACLGNIGPGFGAVGALDNFAHLPIVVKNVLTILMLLGRLELYTVLVLFLPEYWRE